MACIQILVLNKKKVFNDATKLNIGWRTMLKLDPSWSKSDFKLNLCQTSEGFSTS